jgi:hypothetical protein
MSAITLIPLCHSDQRTSVARAEPFQNEYQPHEVVGWAECSEAHRFADGQTNQQTMMGFAALCPSYALYLSAEPITLSRTIDWSYISIPVQNMSQTSTTTKSEQKHGR